jgi:3-oxoacyl-[acyl-carrier protein] reductase
MLWNEIKLKNRTAIVTGGSRGVGAAIVESLLQERMEVWAVARSRENLEKLAQRLQGLAGKLHTEVCDVGEPVRVHKLFQSLRAECSRLFLLVNNAGIGIFGAVDQITLEDWDSVMNVNARGTLLCSTEAFSWMKESGGGRIINIASVVGLKGYANQAVYTASKHAVMGLTKVLAREGQPFGIRASAICPGGIATDLLQSARPDLRGSELIQPADVARAVRYLATQPESCCTDMLTLRRAGSLPFD